MPDKLPRVSRRLPLRHRMTDILGALVLVGITFYAVAVTAAALSTPA